MLRFSRKADSSDVPTPLIKAIRVILWVMEYSIEHREIHRSPNLSRKPGSEMLMKLISKTLEHKSTLKLIDTNQKEKFFKKLKKFSSKELEPLIGKTEISIADIDNAWIKQINLLIKSATDTIKESMNENASQHFSKACHALSTLYEQNEGLAKQFSVTPIQILMKALTHKEQGYLADLIYGYFHITFLTIRAANKSDYKVNTKKDDTVLDDNNNLYFAKLFGPVIHDIVRFDFQGDLKRCYSFSSIIVAQICSTSFFEKSAFKRASVELTPVPDLSLVDFASTVSKLLSTWLIHRGHKGPKMPGAHKLALCRSFSGCIQKLLEQEQTELLNMLAGMTTQIASNNQLQAFSPEVVISCYHLMAQLGLVERFIDQDTDNTIEYLHQVILCMDEAIKELQLEVPTKINDDSHYRKPKAVIYYHGLAQKEMTEATDSLSQDMQRLSIDNKKHFQNL